MGLIEKVVKSKKLQRISGSLAMIIPDLWLRAKGWTQSTEFSMAFHPDTDQIIITAKGKVGFKESMNRKDVTVKPESLQIKSSVNNPINNGEEIGQPVPTLD